MIHIHVISNVFNFMAERTIESISRPCTVSHVDKSQELIDEFRSPWVTKTYLHPQCHWQITHHVMIEWILAHPDFQMGDIIVFVDHDLVFENNRFDRSFNNIQEAFQDPNTLLVFSERGFSYDVMGERASIQTNPLFAVRKDPLVMTNWSTRWKDGRLIADTGRMLYLSLRSRTKLLDEPDPRLHFNCYWYMINERNRRFVEWKEKKRDVERVLRNGGFHPSLRELEIMQKYLILRDFATEKIANHREIKSL